MERLEIDPAECPFCSRLKRGDILMENELAAGFYDDSPLNPGHALVIPKRHETDYFELARNEQAAINELAHAMWQVVAREFYPDGCNLGINVGPAAGQTVGHVHLHVIPRYRGDVKEPRGGVRWIIPARAPYW